MAKHFLILALSLFAAPKVFALDPVRFGPEFTFMPADHKTSTSLVGQMEEAWVRHLIVNQTDGAKFKRIEAGFEQRSQFNSPNGWKFSYYPDSEGIEVGMSPMTVAQFKHFASDIQDAIFVTAANNGNFPALWKGGGHINIDTAVFRQNPLLFRNFIVDLLNHNELFMGIFNYDYKNATPVHIRNPLEAIINGIEWVDSHVSDNYLGIGTRFLSILPRLSSINLINAVWNDASTSRIEIRGVRPQPNIDVFIRQIELLESRIKYLEKKMHPIPFKLKVPLKKVADNYTPPVDPQLALVAFHEYVSESGLQWEDHRDYLWPQWTTGGELRAFEESAWFREHESMSECKSLLTEAAL